MRKRADVAEGRDYQLALVQLGDGKRTLPIPTARGSGGATRTSMD